MSAFQVLTLPTRRDPRGTLTVLQDALPFDVRRVFWITDAAGRERGGHRHRVTRQALVALAGIVEVELNDGRHSATRILDHPSRCLIVEPEDWHVMRFHDNAVLAVFASHPYDQEDYVRSPYEAPSDR